MKLIAALALGFLSGLLIYFGAGMLLADLGAQSGPGTGFVAATLLGGWAASTWLLRRGARSVSKVVARGALLGAAEWLAMIPVGMVLGGKAVAHTVGDAATNAEVAGATIGGGLIATLTGGLSLFMALACLLCFVVAHLLGREMKPEPTAPTQTCPDCAEEILMAARRCRHCGALLAEAPRTGVAA